MKTLLLVTAALALMGCGQDEPDPGSRAHANPPPPLTFPIAAGPVPGWLEEVRPLERGRWVNAQLSPDGETVLAQWLGECEIPIAFFVRRTTKEPKAVVQPHPDAPLESIAVAWDDDGRAGVFLPGAACGAGASRPGLYLVSLDGEREFVTADVDEAERWQASRQ